MDLISAHKSKICGLIRRVQTKLEETSLTVIISTQRDDLTIPWLNYMIATEGIAGVQVKTTDQCRGVEYPTLITITDGSGNPGSRMSDVLDAWTRVTSALYCTHGT